MSFDIDPIENIDAEMWAAFAKKDNEISSLQQDLNDARTQLESAVVLANEIDDDLHNANARIAELEQLRDAKGMVEPVGYTSEFCIKQAQESLGGTRNVNIVTWKDKTEPFTVPLYLHPPVVKESLTVDHSAQVLDMVNEIMEQAQVFASSWSLTGTKFDDGSYHEKSLAEKEELRRMVTALAAAPAKEAE